MVHRPPGSTPSKVILWYVIRVYANADANANLIAHSHFLFVFENPAQIVFRSYKEASRRLCFLWEELVGRGTGSEVRKHLTVCFINDEKLLTAASFPLAPTNASRTT